MMPTRKTVVMALHLVSVFGVLWTLLMFTRDLDKSIWPGAVAIVAFVAARYLVAGAKPSP
jgi:hypothetical protein